MPTRRTPHPAAMSHDEIRHWLRELYYNPGWGWSCHKSELARALGFKGKLPHNDLKSKFRRSWIYAGEDARLATRIRLILQGAIVLKPTGKLNRGMPLYQAEHADPPEPPRPPAHRMTYSLDKQGLKVSIRSPFIAQTSTLPSFKSVFSDARPLRPQALR